MSGDSDGDRDRDPEPAWSAWIVGKGTFDAPSEGTKNVLARQRARDPEMEDVESLIGAVDLVSCFGPVDRKHDLGHPMLLHRIGEYVCKFSCPASTPYEFGMTRAYLASALARGTSQFDEALELLRWTCHVLETRPGHLQHAQKSQEALDWLHTVIKSVQRRERHPWFY